MRNISNVFKIFLKMLCILFLCISFFSLVMIFLYSLPTERILMHAKESIGVFSDNLIKTWAGSTRYSHLSNSTDSIMINNAICRYYDSNIKNALLNPQFNYSGANPTTNLVNYLQGMNNYSIFDYSRYWHGYLLYIIPGLLITNVGGMRTISMFIQFFLTALLIIELSKYNKIYPLLYCAVALFINPVTTVLTFQDADIYCIMIIMNLIVLKYNEKLIQKNRYIYLFLLNGILVCFFDFLTYPLVAWAIPLSLVLLINKQKNNTNLKTVVILSLAWVFGYGGMWLGKWVVVSVFTDYNIFSDALSTVLFRTTGTAEGTIIKYSDVLRKMIESVNDVPMLLLYTVSFALLLYFYLKDRNKLIQKESYLLEYLPSFLLIGVSPFVWYFVVKNHSFIHPWLEYRHLSISFWIIILTLIKLLKLD